MTVDTERSDTVVEDYKKHKLARSAIHRIHEIIHGFEQDRAFDLRMARSGIILLIVLIGLAAYFFFGGERMTLD